MDADRTFVSPCTTASPADVAVTHDVRLVDDLRLLKLHCLLVFNHHTDTTTTDTHRDPATQHTQCLCFEFTNYETMMSCVLPMNAVLSMWHTMSHLQITRISTIPVDLLSSKMYLIEVWLYFNLVMPRSVALNQLLFQIRSAMQTHDLTRPDPAKIGE